MSKRPDALYLQDMLNSIEAIEDFVRGYDYDFFILERKTISATVRELEVIGEAASRISDDIKARSLEIDWRTIKDFRNILSHEYFGIDYKIVWQIVTNKLPPLKGKLIQLLESIKAAPS
ncbi:MAG: DUF86 domain-containing protein [Thermodesulfovibrionales bacterium]|nr:DUF86 domain-containing protein [Thermodesulfovibrionales bacterium]